ncbi:hypothetical protein ACFYYL_18915 [Actinomadura geliboluensis]|uniref:hypothetical protein n=1 Tax=Actinomadura geliboluensis TaxID=882440 RepID=UPI003674CDFA
MKYGGHAHYVIVDRDGHRVWSRHRGTYTLWHDLLRGPDGTIAFIEGQEGGTADFWMNSVWWNAVLLDDPPLTLRAQWAGAPREDDDLSTVAETLVAVRTEAGLAFAGTWAHRTSDVLLAGPEPGVRERIAAVRG